MFVVLLLLLLLLLLSIPCIWERSGVRQLMVLGCFWGLFKLTTHV